ncbi:hypothetical protein B0H63DRAFT_552749 [Podospora didyma]|uniref:Uncharacterized protein n=1 Tax=Podospora didyma TaxID=330526 RepID=A0AAE0K5P4_9PEZI|nr:hypothetical protein B0H63DRAFT_552749 [Podospora didyma]
MDGTSSTKAKAAEHLRRMRREEKLQLDLNNALSTCLNPLYRTQAHFIYELIQNADDNRYHETDTGNRRGNHKEDEDKWLLTDCNEVGFTQEDVDALTGIKQSTKTSSASGKRCYIGDKGFGFKSVFAVAAAVYVSSGDYQFKLDRTQTNGMMRPIHLPFPAALRMPAKTRQELVDMEPQQLLFLRRLKELHLFVPGLSKEYRLETTKDDEDYGASREELKEECEWNEYLCAGVRTAFLKVIQRLTRLPENGRGEDLCNTRPKYLLARGSVPSRPTWSTFYRRTLNALSHEHILRSRAPVTNNKLILFKPPSLNIVPSKYRFNENHDPFDVSSITASYLSFNYDGVPKGLQLLGVRTLTLSAFCDDFKLGIAETRVRGLNEKPSPWHKRISSLFCEQEALGDKLLDLPIIPLMDGRWVKPNTPLVYLDVDSKAEDVPDVLGISVVDLGAAQDSVRRKFFNFLGIKEYNPREMCDLIWKHHQNFAKMAPSEDEDLISDAGFLFQHGSLIKSNGATEIFSSVSTVALEFLAELGFQGTMNQSSVPLDPKSQRELFKLIDNIVEKQNKT